jgi:two-component system response regulator AtoC
MMMQYDIAAGQMADDVIISPRPAPCPLALVVIGEGVSALHPLPPRGVAIVGRAAAATITVRHASLSRQHALLRLGAGGVVTIEDLGSRNGTVLAGRRLLPGEPRVIHRGDVLHLGAVCITLVRP